MDKEINEFLTYMKQVKNRSDYTLSGYGSDLREFSAIIRKHCKEITKSDIEATYVNALVENGNGASTRARKLSAVRSFFRWCKIAGLTESDPAENVEMPKIPHREAKIMSASEINAMIESARDEKSSNSFRDLAIVMLMLNTGIRRCEVCEARLNDLNLEAGSLLVHGKGNKERVVYFNDTTRAVLSEYIFSHRKMYRPAKDSEYIFVSTRAEKLDRRTVNKIIDSALAGAGIKEKGYTAHSTRKAFATAVYRNTRDIVAVQNLLGHSNPTVTMRYVGVSEELKRQAAMTVNFS